MKNFFKTSKGSDVAEDAIFAGLIAVVSLAGAGSSDVSTTTPSTPTALAEHSFTAAANPTNTDVVGRGISASTTQYGSTSSTTGTPAITYITTHISNDILFIYMDGDTTTSPRVEQLVL